MKQSAVVNLLLGQLEYRIRFLGTDDVFELCLQVLCSFYEQLVFVGFWSKEVENGCSLILVHCDFNNKSLELFLVNKTFQLLDLFGQFLRLD